MNDWYTIRWDENAVHMLDQRRLPGEEIYHRYDTVSGVADAIRDMVIRGAPAIGIAAAMGLALAVNRASDDEDLDRTVNDAKALLAATRPTAVNLFWALDRMQARYEAIKGVARDTIARALMDEALTILDEDVDICRRLGEHGAELMPAEGCVLTHCNAGALATGAYGTALSVIRAGIHSGKSLRVFADETRPYLQGARLTSWELQKDEIDVTVIADSAAGHFISRGEVSCVVVGSDRTVANGDVANKIGTYSLAVVCRANNIPFYAAVPISTIDLTTATGTDIPIEERPGDEVKKIGSVQLTPDGVKVRNPAFDVTPAEYVTAIITERGIVRPPYSESLKAIVGCE